MPLDVAVHKRHIVQIWDNNPDAGDIVNVPFEVPHASKLPLDLPLNSRHFAQATLHRLYSTGDPIRHLVRVHQPPPAQQVTDVQAGKVDGLLKARKTLFQVSAELVPLHGVRGAARDWAPGLASILAPMPGVLKLALVLDDHLPK